MWNTITSYRLLLFSPLQVASNVLLQSSVYFLIIPQVDYEMALDYAMQSGVSEEPREAIYLNSLEGSYKFVDLQSPVFVFRFVHWEVKLTVVHVHRYQVPIVPGMETVHELYWCCTWILCLGCCDWAVHVA